MRLLSLYSRHLLAHHFYHHWRQGDRLGHVAFVVRVLTVATLALLWMMVGRYFEALFFAFDRTFNLIDASGYVPGIALALFVTKLVFAGDGLPLNPYRHVPMSMAGVAAYSQMVRFADAPNIFVLSFLVPFWKTSILPRTDFGGAWLGGAIALLILTHVAALTARIFLTRHPYWFWTLLTSLVALVVLDVAGGYRLLSRTSTVLVSGMASGYEASAMLAFIAGCALAASTALVANQIRRSCGNAAEKTTNHISAGAPGTRLWSIARIVQFEARLILRNRVPRYVFKNASVMILIGLIFTFLFSEPSFVFVFLFLIMITYAFSYGQWAFGWNSSHFNGLINLPISRADHVASRLIIMTIAATASLLICTVVVLIDNPSMSSSVVSMYVFTLGCTAPAFLVISIMGTRKVILDANPILNPQGYNWHHYAVFAVLFLFVEVLVRLRSVQAATEVLTVLGIGGLLLMPLQVRVTARLMERSTIGMARRFR